MFAKRLGWLRLAWAERKVSPVVCKETVAELLRVLQYPKFKLMNNDREALLLDYLPYAETAVVSELPRALPVACRDPDDEIFLRLALTSRVAYLVSGDADLTSIQAVLPFRIISAESLRRMLD